LSQSYAFEALRRYCTAADHYHALQFDSITPKQLCSISEAVRIKSGSWDISNRIFVYSTLNHIKYLLPNGDTGIIRTLDVPLYITKAVDKQVCADTYSFLQIVVPAVVTESVTTSPCALEVVQAIRAAAVV
jgi:Coatomer WD associated region